MAQGEIRMIDFQTHTLSNGLRVVVHRDTSSASATLNLRYDVGAKNEDSRRTGFAHLFEHLMFGGSKNVVDFDAPLQRVGGNNNAFTTYDFTIYYINIPSANIETAFWVESDRMLDLTINDETLDVQRHVVVEEFKQRCLNVPYGDTSHLQRELAYAVHPYRWPTIGISPKHIEEAELHEVQDFYARHYAPDNAILSVCGDVDAHEIFMLAEKWFGDIDRKKSINPIADAPAQNARRESHVERDVPADNIAMMYHMDGRTTRDYYIFDIITDILADGTSSRLVQRTIKHDRTLSEVDASILGSHDPGLLTFSGTLLPGVSFDVVERTFIEEMDRMKNGDVSEVELQKVKNRIEATNTFRQLSVQAKAIALCSYASIGDVGLINTESETYASVTPREISEAMQRVCTRENESVLYYHSTQKSQKQ